MHVAFNGYFWDQPHTGSGQYLRHLWDALNSPSSLPDSPEANRNAFTMLLPPGVECSTTSNQLCSRQVVRAAPVPLVGGRAARFDKLLWEEWGVARMAKGERADLLHVPYLSAPAPLLRLRSTPVVVTAHDMIPWVVPGYSGSAAVRLYLAMSAASVKRADLILADSDASRRDVIKVLGVSSRRVRTVYLGVEPHPNYPPHQLQEMRSRLVLPEKYAFYLGGFDSRKNVPLLLRSWRSVVDTIGAENGEKPLLVIGGAVPNPGGVFPDVMREAERLRLTGPGPLVRFIGCVSEADKPLLMAAARLFVYPSAYEGFGLDPLEAMSVGCPVISSSGGSLREVVGDAGLLVPPGDQRALIITIKRAWQDPDLRAALSERGKERARQFTWQRTATHTLRLYQALLKSNQRKLTIDN